MIWLALPLALLAARAAPFERHDANALIDFSYSWPAAAQAVPALRAHLRADMAAAYREATADARADAARGRRAGDYARHDYAKRWRLAGASASLISLAASVETFDGGAHPNHDFEALLWNRRAGRAADVRAVLGPALLRRVTPRYCAALAAERRARDIPVPENDDIFPRCPPLHDVVLVPADDNHDGRFERLEFLIAPYIAGPYVDGAFTPEVRFEAADLAALPAAWRGAFEAAPGRR
jgi:hypothetical protein